MRDSDWVVVGDDRDSEGPGMVLRGPFASQAELERSLDECPITDTGLVWDYCTVGQARADGVDVDA